MFKTLAKNKRYFITKSRSNKLFWCEDIKGFNTITAVNDKNLWWFEYTGEPTKYAQEWFEEWLTENVKGFKLSKVDVDV